MLCINMGSLLSLSLFRPRFNGDFVIGEWNSSRESKGARCSHVTRRHGNVVREAA